MIINFSLDYVSLCADCGQTDLSRAKSETMKNIIPVVDIAAIAANVSAPSGKDYLGM